MRREVKARDMIVRCALQYAASGLLRQRIQGWDGQPEMDKASASFTRRTTVLSNLEEERSDRVDRGTRTGGSVQILTLTAMC